MHVGKRYKLASISLLIFIECWAWHLGAASAACHIAAYIYYMYPSCFLAGEAYPVHISFYISIASSKSFSRPHFYFPHFSISPFLHFSISPFLHFSISPFPFPHSHFLRSWFCHYPYWSRWSTVVGPGVELRLGLTFTPIIYIIIMAFH